ncbi:MAG: 2Fe-2S iron-sulfur cluster binding domain-containing protein [Chloroflexi bacterium]|nr:MAG: 2Fe-2S iron-sulfur cluster binding domain-containing protein [Chloroflexota bacterium]
MGDPVIQKKLEVIYKPFDKATRVPPGTTLFSAAHWIGLPIDSTCGGRGTCGKCKVQVLEGGAEHRARTAPGPEGRDHGRQPAGAARSQRAKGLRRAGRAESDGPAERYRASPRCAHGRRLRHEGRAARVANPALRAARRRVQGHSRPRRRPIDCG